MKQGKIIHFSRNRKPSNKKRVKKRINAYKKGRVYCRGNKLWVDFYYFGQKGT